MDIEKLGVIYCADDDEYRVYCGICEKLCIKRFYKNYPKSQNHTNNVHEKTNQKN